jgi:hypothetical protein
MRVQFQVSKYSIQRGNGNVIRIDFDLARDATFRDQSVTEDGRYLGGEKLRDPGDQVTSSLYTLLSPLLFATSVIPCARATSPRAFMIPGISSGASSSHKSM